MTSPFEVSQSNLFHSFFFLVFFFFLFFFFSLFSFSFLFSFFSKGYWHTFVSREKSFQILLQSSKCTDGLFYGEKSCKLLSIFSSKYINMQPCYLLCGSNQGLGSKFCGKSRLRQEGSRVRKEIPEEGRRAHRPKPCTDINKWFGFFV